MATTVGTIPKPVRLVEGRVLRVGKTRVSLDSVIHAFNHGMDAEQIRSEYTALSLAEVHAAIAYYLHNKEEVDRYLDDRRRAYDRARAEHEKLFPRQITREKLLARKNGEDPNWPPK